MDDSDLWSLLVSGSQPTVDVVLYMISGKGKGLIHHRIAALLTKA